MSLDVFQQTFFLSLSSNLVNDEKGTQSSLQRELATRLAFALPIIPQWKVVWGPVVWKNKPDDATTGPDNSWYVAYNPGFRFEDGSVHPTYVIAIAGTPLESEYAWITENFGVNAVADFNAWVVNGIQNLPVVVPAAQVKPGNPYIARGIVNAVHLLLTTPAPKDAAGPGLTLVDFIANIAGSGNNRFIATGSSLGAALSTSLALALVSSRIIPAHNTLTYPTAGPSPGNKGFTDLFIATFPARKSASAKSYQGWNLNLVNTLDIVPRAWSLLGLGSIPPIYGKPVLPIVRGATIVFAFYTLISGALYFPLPSQQFTSSPLPNTPKDLKEFLLIAGRQHVGAYFKEVGVDIPTRNRAPASGITDKTEDEIRFNYPIISELEWAREHPKEAEKEIKKVEDTKEAKAFLEENASSNDV